MKYEVQPLGKYIDIISGYAFKTKDFVAKGVPIIKIKNITPPEVNLSDLSYVSSDITEKLKKYELSHGDILIAMTGSHINQMTSVVGRIAKVKYSERTMLNQRVGKIVAKESADCCLDYVYHFLSQNSVKIRLASKAGGAANQANISPTDIKALEMPSPSLPTQHHIAEILSAYDDLIENNQKQIKLLEEAAMLLYKEWFVKLRFPGHENAKIVDGLPEGWRKGTIKDFGEIITGKTPSTTIAENFNGSIPFVKIPDMHNVIFPLTTEITLSTKGAASQRNKSLPIGSVLVSCIATVGLVCITHAICQTNQQINSIVPSNPDDRFYLYCVMKGLKNILLGIGSSGATMTNVNKTKFENLPIMIPEQIVLTIFTELCEPLFGKIIACQQQIQQARAARDKLLPKLINGEIEV